MRCKVQPVAGKRALRWRVDRNGQTYRRGVVSGSAIHVGGLPGGRYRLSVDGRPGVVRFTV